MVTLQCMVLLFHVSLNGNFTMYGMTISCVTECIVWLFHASLNGNFTMYGITISCVTE